MRKNGEMNLVLNQQPKFVSRSSFGNLSFADKLAINTLYNCSGEYSSLLVSKPIYLDLLLNTV